MPKKSFDDIQKEEREAFEKTGKQSNTFLEEPVSFSVFKPTVKNGTVSYEAQEIQETQKTMYITAPFETVICSHHFFEPVSLSRYVFKCKKCSYYFQSRQDTHRYDPSTGSLFHRKTGKRV